jgi:hypothetical protein
MVNYHSFDIDEAVKFIGKSKDSIYEMKRKLGLLTVPNWNKEQEKFLVENGCEATALLTNKSINSCRIKLCRLRKNQ